MSAMDRAQRAFDELARAGLGVIARLPTAGLSAVMPAWADDASRWPTTVLVGSTGPTMWQRMSRAAALGGRDPVDTWCRAALRRFRDDLAAVEVGAELLWPYRGAAQVPLVQLGARAGWAHPSPLGIGLHPVHGPWVAYRGVLRMDVDLGESLAAGPSPCASCADTPCVTACPVGAPSRAGFDLRACFGERQRPGSECATTCAARLMCPVGAGSRYGAAQIAHHHRAAMRAFRDPPA